MSKTIENGADINEILRSIPHRYPMLLVDRIIEYKSGEYISGLKNVTINEQFFVGHFPDTPIMPGVLIIEALAQLSAVYVNFDGSFDSLRTPVLTSIKDAKFTRIVSPGDVLSLRASLLRYRLNLWQFECVASVGDEVASKAQISAMLK